jgi:hypothetical protein
MAKKKSNWTSKDVYWYAAKYKRPIAYSTVADSEAISLINQPNMTANELMAEMTSGKWLVGSEMLKVIQAYIDKGLGDELITTNFH